MKKKFLCILAAVMLLCLCGCAVCDANTEVSTDGSDGVFFPAPNGATPTETLSRLMAARFS